MSCRRIVGGPLPATSTGAPAPVGLPLRPQGPMRGGVSVSGRPLVLAILRPPGLVEVGGSQLMGRSPPSEIECRESLGRVVPAGQRHKDVLSVDSGANIPARDAQRRTSLTPNDAKRTSCLSRLQRYAGRPGQLPRHGSQMAGTSPQAQSGGAIAPDGLS